MAVSVGQPRYSVPRACGRHAHQYTRRTVLAARRYSDFEASGARRALEKIRQPVRVAMT